MEKSQTQLLRYEGLTSDQMEAALMFCADNQIPNEWTEGKGYIQLYPPITLAQVKAFEDAVAG